jgi:hypothetical protein
LLPEDQHHRGSLGIERLAGRRLVWRPSGA